MDEQAARFLASQLRQPSGDEGAGIGEWMNRGNGHMNRQAITVVAPQEGEHILEIGMGNGYFVSELLQSAPNIRYTGCDFSEIMVHEANRINKHHVATGQAAFIYGNINELSFSDSVFDKVFTVNTIYFWADSAHALAEIKRVLKPGGQCFISLRPRRQMERYPFTQYGFTMYAAEDVRQLLLAAGFSDIIIEEHQEPDFELNGELLNMENVVVSGSR